jgi:drug/metabolite transporter (DMT)-like permease
VAALDRSAPAIALTPLTTAMWLAVVVFGSANAVAVRLGTFDLPPYWGAAVRFGLAAGIFLAMAIGTRRAFPRGRTMRNAVTYGALMFGATYALLYRGLVDAPAGVGQVVMAFAPLVTVCAAALVRIETFSWQGLLGTVVAAAGIALVFQDQVQQGAPLSALFALAGAASCMGLALVMLKRFPVGDGITANCVGMATGTVILLVLSTVSGEAWQLPSESATWLAVTYLVLLGSVGVFWAGLYVVERWSASATSYALLLHPIGATILGALILGEGVTPSFVFGALIVIAGVYIGAFAPEMRTVLRRPAPG